MLQLSTSAGEIGFEANVEAKGRSSAEDVKTDDRGRKDGRERRERR
jgi:hypothetical protein